MLKNVVSPIQAWLLSQGRCVGCGKYLSQGQRESHKKGEEKVNCSCGRIYIYTPSTTHYRRALLSEV
jgi:predicted  nucleic acid-binding Zn-ribbon protein